VPVPGEGARRADPEIAGPALAVARRDVPDTVHDHDALHAVQARFVEFDVDLAVEREPRGPVRPAAVAVLAGDQTRGAVGVLERHEREPHPSVALRLAGMEP
jgi:hypothetical protein